MMVTHNSHIIKYLGLITIMYRKQLLSLLQICPILLVHSYSFFPQISERDRRKLPRQTSSTSHNIEYKRDSWSLPFLSIPSSEHTSFDNNRSRSSIFLSSDTIETTVLERKRFIAVSTAACSAVLGLKPAWGTTVDPKTGIRLPDPGEIEASVPTNWKDEENPISSSGASNSNTQFGRLDGSADSIFYQDPRFVEHVDENAVKLLTEYVSNIAIQPGRDASVLDLCSSWTSHVDANIAGKISRISGLGMNAKELDRNTALTDWIVQDLNENPQLSKYENESFDVVLLQLSIDYLTKPLQVLKEVGRVLKFGGQIHVIFSNRLFLSKAVGLWTGGDDIDHAYYVGSYLQFCEGGFEDIKAKDLSNRKGGKDKRIVGDPLFVVSATKRNA